MQFISFEFTIFLPIVFILYWLVFNRINTRSSNIFLIIVNYIFYGWWNWKLCFLLFGVTTVTYSAGVLMTYLRENDKNYDTKKRVQNPIWWIHFLTIILCIGTLGIFKYYDFFVESLSEILSLAGIKVSLSGLNLILPLGISFYIFQSLTYTIDIYQLKIKHTKDIFAYFAFMSFFPQLLSGPIGRASSLLPQYEQKRIFQYDLAIRGCWQILWGLFMKVCIADRLSVYVDAVYENIALHNGASIALAAVLYSIQIYCDFAGYSLMAIGIGCLFGIKLDENFHQPYFATSIGDFWRRWHISLSKWFRDYVYIPLGGNRVGVYRNYFNLFVTFLVSGLWHGAAWSFVLWGALHGVYQILDKMCKKNLPTLNIKKPIKDAVGIIVTFILVTIAWIFFRLTDISMAFKAVNKIFTQFGGGGLYTNLTTMVYGGISLVLLIIVEILLEKNKLCSDSILYNKRRFVIIRYITAILLSLWIISAGVFGGGQFIYFQF